MPNVAPSAGTAAGSMEAFTAEHASVKGVGLDESPMSLHPALCGEHWGVCCYVCVCDSEDRSQGLLMCQAGAHQGTPA